MTTFPTNPIDGQLFTSISGSVFRYWSASNSWQRFIKPEIPLATTETAGAMSAADYQKLMGLLLPPPQSTILVDGCDPVSVGFLHLEGDDIIEVSVDPDNIHENTGLIKFSVNSTNLLDRLISEGRVQWVAEKGDKGETGDAGDPGLDSLPVGPYGDPGPDGANVEWPGGLIQDDTKIKSDDKAIVEISTKLVSETENYLVVKRAYIGNPSACPDKIIPQEIQSPWILAFPPNASQSVRRKVNGKSVCTWTCSSSLYYFNINGVIDSIRSRMQDYLAFQKTQKETQLQLWTDQMKDVFDEQAAALYCALEFSKSKYRNADARRYVESTKIAAAGAGPGYNLSYMKIEQGVIPSFYTRCKTGGSTYTGGGSSTPPPVTPPTPPSTFIVHNTGADVVNGQDQYWSIETANGSGIYRLANVADTYEWWFVPPTGSNWVTVNGGRDSWGGIRKFKTHARVTGTQSFLDTLTIKINISADDNVKAITINGTSVDVTELATLQYSSWLEFTLPTELFVIGTNEIVFSIEDGGIVAGLWVQWNVS